MANVAAMLVERATRHGDFNDHARVTQGLKAVVHHERNWDNKLCDIHREAIDMILHKIGRIVAGDPNWHDHWDDIAGYAKITSDRLEKKDG